MKDLNSDDREYPTFVTHLECAFTGEKFEADKIHELSSAGKPIIVKYDLNGIAGQANEALDKVCVIQIRQGEYHHVATLRHAAQNMVFWQSFRVKGHAVPAVAIGEL